MEIAVQGRSTMVSPIEMIAQGGIEYSPPTPDKSCKHANNFYPPVKPYIPPHGSIKPGDTRNYHGVHRNYTPRPRKKHMPVIIRNVNPNYRRRGEVKITERQLSHIKPPKMR